MIRLRRQHPRWCPKKLNVVLERSMPSVQVPSVRTIAPILERVGRGEGTRGQCAQVRGAAGERPEDPDSVEPHPMGTE